MRINMKKLSKVFEPIILVCIVGTIITTALNFFAVVAASFGYFQPFHYFQYMRLPYWAVLLPAAGILLLFPLALNLAFQRETIEEKMRPPQNVDLRHAIEGLRSKFRLRPV